MIEKLRVANRSMLESKLRGVDFGTVFQARISERKRAGAGMGATQIGFRDPPE